MSEHEKVTTRPFFLQCLYRVGPLDNSLLGGVWMVSPDRPWNREPGWT